MAKEIVGLTTKQVMAGFGVSDMTVYSWRKGTPTKDPLPCHQNGAKVVFKETELVKWAKKYGLTWDAVKAGAVTANQKSGPKPKAAVPAKKSAKPLPVPKPRPAKAAAAPA